jgi:hypothetical protein
VGGIAFAASRHRQSFFVVRNVDPTISPADVHADRKKNPARFARYARHRRPINAGKENVMGKYFIGWLLGVPLGVLVLIYLFMHVL